MRRSGSARSLRRRILLPFAVGALMLGLAVGASAVLETRQGAVNELEKRALGVQRTLDGAIERSGQRAREDAALLAEQPSLGPAVERRTVADFSRKVTPFAIEKDYDVVAIMARSGDELFVSGSASLLETAPARALALRSGFGIPGSAIFVTGAGTVVVYASVPVRAASGIVGLVLVARTLDAPELAGFSSPLDASVAVTRRGAGAAPPPDVAAARSYAYAVELGESKATLHVFVSGAELARATRFAVLLAVGLGLVFALGLILLVRTLLSRAVTQPLSALRVAIREIGRGQTGVRVAPDGARELREVGDGFNRMLDALAAETELRRGVMDATTDGIFAVALDGRLTLVNERACELTGYERNELIGRVPSTLVSPADGVRLRTLLAARAGEAGTAALRGIELVGKDGTRGLVNLSCSVLRDGDRTTGLVLIAEDVMEQALLERQLRQSQKLEAVGQLAGGIAHDFNNLLTGIIGYAELMLGERTPADPDHESLTVIKRTGEQAAALTSQLLAFSRKQVLVPEVLDLNAKVLGLEKLLTRLLGADVELVTALERPLGAVMADPSQIEQVIMNLVINARDAMPDGGTVTLETASVASTAIPADRFKVPPGEYVRLTVSDTGTGIPTSVLEHLFEPFFTTKEQGRGTGLGLSTVYGIVTQSGGFIFAENNPGVGARFNLYFPRVSAPVAQPASASALAGGEPGSETVLVVDDEDVVRNVTRRSLESRGYLVVEAVDGLDALEVYARLAGTIDLVLTDLTMPGMGGHELVDRLRALRPDVPVIYTSGHMDDALVRKDLSADGTLFLQKPFSIDALTRIARRALDASPARHALCEAEAVRIP